MAKADVMRMLYSKNKSPSDFNFDSLLSQPLPSFLYVEEMEKLYNIATSIRYSGKMKMKYKAIDDILRPRGFKKLASGTNRIAYRHLENTGVILKTAIDTVGIGDNPADYKNQFLLKPFITKVFDLGGGGCVGLFERVQPITSKLEFSYIAPSIFDLICSKIIGKYVLEDIGTDYFMNWGIRDAFGPVLLDFPYVFELDGGKLYCNKPIPEKGYAPCGGTIDYDDGFNKLICQTCGKHYHARDLQKKESGIVLMKEEMDMFKVQICKGDKIIKSGMTDADIIRPNKNVYQSKKIDVRPTKLSSDIIKIVKK